MVRIEFSVKVVGSVGLNSAKESQSFRNLLIYWQVHDRKRWVKSCFSFPVSLYRAALSVKQLFFASCSAYQDLISKLLPLPAI